jgi:hypothetical protein
MNDRQETLRAWLRNVPGIGVERAQDIVDSLRAVVQVMAAMMLHNPEAPNFITISYETDEDGPCWELTIRKHTGMAPGAKIAALEDENEKLRARLAEMKREARELGDG